MRAHSNLGQDGVLAEVLAEAYEVNEEKFEQFESPTTSAQPVEQVLEDELMSPRSRKINAAQKDLDFEGQLAGHIGGAILSLALTLK